MKATLDLLLALASPPNAICCPTAGPILVLNFSAMREAVEHAERVQAAS
ncbi:MAG TPA: hypothetical protein VFN67_31110 [Polyangiales bacterium]|nr:hypothetical protein [Polyangiales bacterium]